MASCNAGKQVMTDEHKEVLTRHLPTLMSDLNLTAKFWGILLSLLVLTDSEVQTIKGVGRSDDEQVLDLVQNLKKKSDDCFFNFLKALSQTGQLHLITLLEKPQELAATGGTPRYSMVFSDESTRYIQLKIRYSLLRMSYAVEMWTWAADKRYVPIDQIFTDLLWVRRSGYNFACDSKVHLGNYMDMFKCEGEIEAGFVFLEGQAGSGKSTLVQMLAVSWCKQVQRRWLEEVVDISEQEESYFKKQEKYLFSKFKYVILMFLRHVKTGMSLLDVIESQYCVESATAELLYGRMRQFQEETLIILEGYDEYLESTSSDITDIAHRKTFKEATIMITSRHSHSYHFSDVENRNSPDNHILLKGFNENGVSHYTNNFFQYSDKTKVGPLLACIKQSDELTTLSRFPAILLLICTLWAHDHSLSDSITEFFIRFVAYVCGRYEMKFVRPSQRAISKNIIDKYHDYLMQIGEISLSGFKENKLQLTFLYRDVIDTVGETAWQLGFLKRQSPMDGDDLVAFPHKIMQEFFSAYFIVRCNKSKQRELFIKICSSIKAVQESEKIQTFISGLGGEEIKEEIEKIIDGTEDDKAEIIPALQLSFLAENLNVHLKLPGRVVLTISDRYREAVYKHYLCGDCTSVTHLTVLAGGYHFITDTSVIPAIVNMIRLTELTFGRNSLSASGLESLSNALTSESPPLTTLDLQFAVVGAVPGASWSKLMYSLPVTLQTLDVSVNKITGESVRRLSQRLPHFKQLRAIKMHCCKLKDFEAFLELITNSASVPTLIEIDVNGNNLGDRLIELVHVTKYMSSLRKLQLSSNNMSRYVNNRIVQKFKKNLPKLSLGLSIC